MLLQIEQLGVMPSGFASSRNKYGNGSRVFLPSTWPFSVELSCDWALRENGLPPLVWSKTMSVPLEPGRSEAGEMRPTPTVPEEL